MLANVTVDGERVIFAGDLKGNSMPPALQWIAALASPAGRLGGRRAVQLTS